MIEISDKLAIFNETKLQILNSLLNCGDFMCGCDLTQKLNIPKNLLSYHIKLLQDMNYIEEKRCGRNKRYSIKPESKEKVEQIFDLLEKI